MKKKYLALSALAFLLALIYFSISRTNASASSEEASDVIATPKMVTQPTISLIFAGDMMLHMPQVMAARTDSGYDFRPSFRQMKRFFESADFAVINFETTLAERDFSGYPMFRSPRQIVDAIHDAGIDVAVMANNHCCDGGRAGIEMTTRCFDSIGIRRTGVYTDSADMRRHNVLILEKDLFRVALLNYTYGTNGIQVPRGALVNRIDTTAIKRDIAEARSRRATNIVVFFHWGAEYEQKPNTAQTRLAQWCRKNGVDIIIGSHPHVVQPIEQHLDAKGEVEGITVYSLGNLVSNQRVSYRDGGAAVRLTLSIDGIRSMRYEPQYLVFWVNDQPMDGRGAYEIIPSFMTDSLLSSNEWIKSKYTRFVTNARNVLNTKNHGFKEIIYE